MNRSAPNYTLLGIILILVFLGISAIASASAIVSWNNFGNAHYYLVHQLIFGVLPGLAVLVAASRLNYQIWRKLAVPLMFLAVAFLVAVFIPGVGASANGASRWVNLGFTLFQPSELAKLALIVYVAARFDKRKSDIQDFRSGFLPGLLAVGIIGALIFMQPDLGTLMVITLTAASMFFTAGSKIKHLVGTASVALVGLVFAIMAAPYRAARIITFLDPSHDPQGIGYHVNQALLAVGAGGLLGYGYNRSLQKHNYLPEPMGDSIFAVMAEELGFLRVSILIILFLVLAFIGFRIAKNAPDNFGKLLAVGICSWVTIQAFINIGAMLGILPLTGVPLPLISYGSSALIITLWGLGILLNISRNEV